MNSIASAPRAIINYLGDAGHRRFVSVVVALAATKVLGHAVGQDQVANTLDLLIGGLGGAWNKLSVAPRVAVANAAPGTVTPAVVETPIA